MPKLASSSASPPIIESLENRQLLSSGPVLSFAGRIPSVLSPSSPTVVQVRLVNTTRVPVTGPQQVELFAGDNVLLGSVTQSKKINAGAAVTIRVPIEPPPDLPDGSYSLSADLNGSTATTALSPRSIAYKNPFSDLAVQFSKLPQQPVQLQGPGAGRAIATVLLTNAGNIPAHGQVDLNFYLSADAVLDPTDPLLASVPGLPVSLKPGGHQSVSFHVTVPPNTTAGGYFLFAVLTPTASLNDSNPADNTAVSSRRIAVVTAIPQPAKIIKQINISSNSTTINQNTVVYVDDSGCTTDSGDVSEDPSNDSTGGSSGDCSGDSSDATNSDPQPVPSDVAGDPNTASDDWDDTDSSGGDF